MSLENYHSDIKCHSTLNTIFGVVTLDTFLHFMSCRVHVVFPFIQTSLSPKLECKVKWNGWHQINENGVRAQNIETILESLMNIVEKTYMTISTHTHTHTLTTTSYRFSHLNSYRKLDITTFVFCNRLLNETFHLLKIYRC